MNERREKKKKLYTLYTMLRQCRCT